MATEYEPAKDTAKTRTLTKQRVRHPRQDPRSLFGELPGWYHPSTAMSQEENVPRKVPHPPVRAMGTDLRQLCGELRDDVDWLRRKWSNFQELFGKGQERIDLLNRAASNFFYFLHGLFFEDAMLHLCRLSDPPKTRLRTGDRENLSVLALSALVSDPVLKASVGTKAGQVRKSCEFARKWRNQRLAHTDLINRRKGHALTLPPVTGNDIDSALKSIGDVLTLVEDHCGLPHYVLGPDPWGAKSLVHYLEKADKAIEKEHEQWRKLAAKA